MEKLNAEIVYRKAFVQRRASKEEEEESKSRVQKNFFKGIISLFNHSNFFSCLSWVSLCKYVIVDMYPNPVFTLMEEKEVKRYVRRIGRTLAY